MKKYLYTLLLISFITPSVAFASWWNPLSWLNGKGFSSQSITKNETLDKHTKESDKKLENVITSTIEVPTKKVVAQPTKPLKPKKTIDAEKPVLANWVASLDTEIQDASDWIVALSDPSISQYTSGMIEVYSIYKIKIADIRSQMNDIYLDTSTDYNTVLSQKQKINILITQYNQLKSQVKIDFEVAKQESINEVQRNADARVKKAQKAYDRAYTQQQAADKENLDNLNARINYCNSFRGRGRGVPESIVEAQLRAVGCF